MTMRDKLIELLSRDDEDHLLIKTARSRAAALLGAVLRILAEPTQEMMTEAVNSAVDTACAIGAFTRDEISESDLAELEKVVSAPFKRRCLKCGEEQWIMGYPCPAIGEPAYGWRASPPIPKITRNRAKHLGRYVDEFAFRFNEGDVKRHTMQRLDSFIDGVAGKRLTYKALTH